MLVAIVPAAQVAGLDAAYDATLAGIPDGLLEDEGVAAGAAAAAAMLAARQDDGFLAPFTFTIGLEPGNWRPVGFSLDPPSPGIRDPDAWVGNLKPFLIESPSQFRSEGPNAVDERRVCGGVQRGEGARCAEQLDEDGGPDDRSDLLAVRPDRVLESTRPRPLRRSTASASRTRRGSSR